jgi:uncharacterized membrane protein YccC
MLRSLQRLLEGAARRPAVRAQRPAPLHHAGRVAAGRGDGQPAPDAPVFRHALRTCATATAAYALARCIPWMPHPQWIVLTILAVMQGNLALTLMRRNARVLGTLAGCLAVLALTTAGSSTLFLTACFLVASGVAHAFFGVRYSVTAAAAAVMALLQAWPRRAGQRRFSTFERFGDTVAGAALGWAATFVLPTWERRNLPATLRQAVAAMRAYAAEATALRDDTRACRASRANAPTTPSAPWPPPARAASPSRRTCACRSRS